MYKNRSDVLPAEAAGKPQLHLSRMRLDEKYEAVTHDGSRKLVGGRVISID